LQFGVVIIAFADLSKAAHICKDWAAERMHALSAALQEYKKAAWFFIWLITERYSSSRHAVQLVQYNYRTASASSNSESALHAFNKLNLICVLKIPLLLLQSLLWKVGENTYRTAKNKI